MIFTVSYTWNYISWFLCLSFFFHFLIFTWESSIFLSPTYLKVPLPFFFLKVFHVLKLQSLWIFSWFHTKHKWIYDLIISSHYEPPRIITNPNLFKTNLQMSRANLNWISSHFNSQIFNLNSSICTLNWLWWTSKVQCPSWYTLKGKMAKQIWSSKCLNICKKVCPHHYGQNEGQITRMTTS
jgi:hypothetical protein